MSFLILVLTFHHQLLQVDLVAPSRVPDVCIRLLWSERTTTAWISCASRIPTSDFFFPSIIKSICVCRDSKERAVWQTSDKVLETDGFCVCDSDSERERKCCTAHRTREVPSVIQTTPFIQTPSAVVSCSLKQHTCRPKKNTNFHSRTLVFARPPIPAPFTCCPKPPRCGLVNLFVTFSK